MMEDDALIDAKKAAGGVVALAQGLGISSAAVSQWQRVPASRVLRVEWLTGISRHRLRPDLYPSDQSGHTSLGGGGP